MEKTDLFEKRREKNAELAAMGVALYARGLAVDACTADLIARFSSCGEEELGKMEERFSLAGRIMAVRDFGKAAFVILQDRKGRLQVYVSREKIGQEQYQVFKKLDVGDIVFARGKVFRTRTGELTLEALCVQLLTKALRPLPEKWHGLTDVEARYRQRHLDLITNPEVRKVFLARCRIIGLIREFMNARDFLEVETPMMQSQAGGALARPFVTHHNALDMDLFLRIAPELYLKRLLVGDLERVYEINRNFRNEGISTFHNPEFTMMEFYQAYATYEDFMDMTEKLFCHIAGELFGGLKFSYQGTEIDLTPPWRRQTVSDAVLEATSLEAHDLANREKLAAFASGVGIEVNPRDAAGKLLMAIFETVVEEKLIQPTFITGYPVEVSPLARRNDESPAFTDRFELYIHGREIANAFTELNDPMEQRDRFLSQQRERDEGDGEAHEMDDDYIKVLEYGMPPAAGEGIGIDRLVMLFTDSASIRDVILFPLLRKKD